MNSSFTLFLQLNLKMLGVITEISFRQAPHLPSQAMSTRPILILTSLFQALSTKEECRVTLEDGYSFHKVQCTINLFTFYTEFRVFYSSKKREFLKVLHFFFPFPISHVYDGNWYPVFPAILFWSVHRGILRLKGVPFSGVRYRKIPK